MKKTMALLLSVVIAVSFAACSGIIPEGKKHISADSSVLEMSFVQPEEYVSVKRSIDRLADGSVTEKTMTYTFADGSSLAFSTSKNIEEGQIDSITKYIDSDKLENREIAGKEFMVFEYDELYAICQEGATAYGVQFTFAENDGTATDDAKTSPVFDKALEGLSFTDNTETAENEEGLDGITYTQDETLNVISVLDAHEETKEGDTVSKSYTWRYGTGDKVDFRFVIRVMKNAQLADQLDSEKTYSEKTIGDITYTVREDGDGNIFEYYTQQGENVYIIKNLGDEGSWFTTRSEESYAALEKLINSISFG